MLNKGCSPSSTLPVFSARPGLGYGTLTLYHSRYFLIILVVLTVTKPMYHRHTSITKVDICEWWTSTNVTSVKVARPWYNDLFDWLILSCRLVILNQQKVKHSFKPRKRRGTYFKNFSSGSNGRVKLMITWYSCMKNTEIYERLIRMTMATGLHPVTQLTGYCTEKMFFFACLRPI